jgi:hypothetical protein
MIVAEIPGAVFAPKDHEDGEGRYRACQKQPFGRAKPVGAACGRDGSGRRIHEIGNLTGGGPRRITLFATPRQAVAYTNQGARLSDPMRSSADR